MNIAIEKKELIQWIRGLDNPSVIEQIKQIKKQENNAFDFEKEWEQGVTIDEARENTREFLKSLPWKK